MPRARDARKRAVVDDLAVAVDAIAREIGLTLERQQIVALADYARLVLKWQHITNLTAAESAQRFVDDHVADCLALVPWLGGGRLLDVGSGAGLPGVVVALACPALEVTLLEPRARRARFLTQARIELHLARVDVVRERVENFRPRHAYDYVVARALTSLPAFVEAAVPLQRCGATLIAMKSNVDPDELAAAERAAGKGRVIALRVPGHRTRNLVVFDASGRAAGPK